MSLGIRSQYSLITVLTTLKTRNARGTDLAMEIVLGYACEGFKPEITNKSTTTGPASFLR